MCKKQDSIAVCVLAFASWICGASAAFAQECPRENPAGPTVRSRVRTLEGKLVFHNDIRGWFELRLDKPQCGNDSVQLVPREKKIKNLEVFTGCRIRSSGSIDIPGTGYFSAALFQDVEKVEPVGKCALRPPFPDYSGAVPDKGISAYTVNMQLDYRPGDHPIVFLVRSAGRELRPWQAYASYELTGGFVLYGFCAKGFVVDKVYGTPAAHPGHFDDPQTPDDMAMFDPESAAASGHSDLRLGYTCIRESLRHH